MTEIEIRRMIACVAQYVETAQQCYSVTETTPESDQATEVFDCWFVEDGDQKTITIKSQTTSYSLEFISQDGTQTVRYDNNQITLYISNGKLYRADGPSSSEVYQQIYVSGSTVTLDSQFTYTVN